MEDLWIGGIVRVDSAASREFEEFCCVRYLCYCVVHLMD